MTVFIQTLYVYLGSLLCIRNDGNAILCCFYDFHHFVTWRGWRGVPTVFMGACWSWLSPRPVSGWAFILFGNEMDTLLPQSTISWEEERAEKEKCMHEISTEKNACLLKMVLLSSMKDFPILYIGLSLLLSGQPEHLQIWRWFFLLCHEVAVPWIPTCCPLPLACEKRGAQVRNRNETQVITLSDTTHGALAQFLEGQRFLYFIFFP